LAALRLYGHDTPLDDRMMSMLACSRVLHIAELHLRGGEWVANLREAKRRSDARRKFLS